MQEVQCTQRDNDFRIYLPEPLPIHLHLTKRNNNFVGIYIPVLTKYIYRETIITTIYYTDITTHLPFLLTLDCNVALNTFRELREGTNFN
jgi:hypothetical protein